MKKSKTLKKNIYLSKDEFNCSDFVVYKDTKSKFNIFIDGIKSKTQKGYIHKSLGEINKFNKELTKIPNSYKTKKLKKNFIKKYYCNKNLIELKDDNEYYKAIQKKIPKNAKSYFTHYNGGRPYLVYIYKKGTQQYVSIYKFDETKYEYSDNVYENKKLYITPVFDFKPQNIYVGKSPKTKITTLSDGYGPEFDGNTILLDMGNKFIFIINEIIEFNLEKNARIKKYVSEVGNSDVPYPYIVDDKNNYYLLIDLKILLNLETKDNPYMLYYLNKEELNVKKLKHKTLVKRKL
jgi:hypothetical protein